MWRLAQAPRREWSAIATSPDAIPRDLWGVVLAAMAVFVTSILWVGEFGLRHDPIVQYRTRADGSMTLVATGELITPGHGMAALLWVGGILVAILALYGLTLANASRFGAYPDRRAALVLVAYAAFPAVLGGLLQPIPLSSLLMLGGIILSIILFYTGAPIMLRPTPGIETRFGRAIAFRATGLLLSLPLLAQFAGVILARSR